MPEFVTISKERLDRFEERVKSLAQEKSSLQLVTTMMKNLSAVPGLDNTVGGILRIVCESIGGTNVILYYLIDGEMFYADLLGDKRKIQKVQDFEVETVLQTHEFIEYEHDFKDTLMLTQECMKAWTWIFPLLVDTETIGILKMEKLHVGTRRFMPHLPTFFKFAALILKNEISGHTSLKRAYDRLRQEVEVRKEAQAQLEKAREELEQKVLERTFDLQKTNDRLHMEVAERRWAEEQLEEINRTLEQRVQMETALRLEKERMLLQQSRLAAMGEMIGSIAHQWRQPLNAVQVLLFEAKDAMDYGQLDGNYFAGIYEKAKEQISYMSRTIDDFRDFFKPSKAKTLFDAKVAVGEAFSILSERLKKDSISYSITCINHGKVFRSVSEILCCYEARVYTYKNDFLQAVLNVINNASDAILNRRKIGQATEAPLEGIIEVTFKRESAGRISIKISDNGGGIADDIKEKVFEPYFTTKFKSQGTGIGLYMSKIIIEKNLGGKISVENDAEGAVFTIELNLEMELQRESE